MKYTLVVLVSVTLVLSACSDSPTATQEGNVCIEYRQTPVTEHSIDSADIQTANALFSKHGINYSNYRFFNYSHDSTQTYFPPYAKYYSQVFRVEEYIYGLHHFTGQLNFIFKNGAFESKSGNSTKGTTLDTIPNLSIGQLQKLHFAAIQKQTPRDLTFKDSCFTAEFGYYNLNVSTGNTPEKLIKAWKVSLKNSKYPMAYYQDSDGKLLSYDNGIRTIE